MLQPGNEPRDNNSEESEKTQVARPSANSTWQEPQAGSSGREDEAQGSAMRSFGRAESSQEEYGQWGPPSRDAFSDELAHNQQMPVYREQEDRTQRTYQNGFGQARANDATEAYDAHPDSDGYGRQLGMSQSDANEATEAYRANGASAPLPVGQYHSVQGNGYSPEQNGTQNGYGTYQQQATGMQASAAQNANNGATWGAYGNAQKPVRRGGLQTGAIILLVLVLLLVFGTGLFAGWQFKQDQTSGGKSSTQSTTLQQSGSQKVPIPTLNSNNLQQVREAVIQDVRPAVVEITVTTNQGRALGSGVIVDKNGYIVTNNHVVQGARSIDSVVLYDGKTVRNATLVGTDPADDLAVIKITPPMTLTTVPIGDSSKVVVGQDVLAIGSPLGDAQTVTNGIISAVGRNVSEQNGVTLPNALQTDAPINPGNSGGALVDLSGHLIGIPTLTAVDPEFNAPASGVGFAVASNRVNLVVPQLIQTGKVSHTGRAALGIQAVDVDQNVQAQDNLAVDHGVLVAGLVSGGAAQKAGLQVGDVIVQIDNTPVNTLAQLQDALISKNVGDKVTVNVYRGNQQMSFNVTLGELQSQQ